ncbi:MAG: shikimate kinase [Planctomycetes bacterium]|nr:shikimate kinase [Planctomycetota bacterium]
MADTLQRNVVLIGYRGVGKTSIGKRLAEMLGVPFVDIDEIIASEAGMSIAEIFAAEGEAGFRKHEKEVIARVAATVPAVVSVGGGAVLDEENVSRLKAGGVVVWLTAPAEVLWSRISSDESSAAARPALTAHSGLEEVRTVLSSREALYRGAADVVVSTAGRTPQDVTIELVRRLDESVDRGV